MDTLKELFDENEVNLAMESRVQTAPRSAQDLFVICLTMKPTSTQRKLSWLKMQEDQAVVLDN